MVSKIVCQNLLKCYLNIVDDGNVSRICCFSDQTFYLSLYIVISHDFAVDENLALRLMEKQEIPDFFFPSAQYIRMNILYLPLLFGMRSYW